MHNNEELKALLAREGKILTENERRKIAEAQAVAAAIVTEQYEPSRPPAKTKNVGTIERALVAVPHLVNFISDVGNTLTTLTQAIIPAALPVLLIGLVFAEAERVRHGVRLFESHDYLAYLVSYILVMGNVFIELAIQHRHHATGYQKTSGYEFSLRILWERIRYMGGWGASWQARPKSPALRLERLQRALTAAILFLAIGGSMRQTIESQAGNWRAGLVSIAVESTLLELLTWGSGLVSAVVIVLLAQAIVAYAYARAAEYYHELLDRQTALQSDYDPKLQQWERDRGHAIDTARIQAEQEYLIGIMAKKGISAPISDFGNTPPAWVAPANGQPTRNGNGHIASDKN